ncbi:Rieske 2Fe-2S domain-containing protein [Halopolyspora algeriensis]|nr:Rieske 2Fe-2S domain-containing protein [Halopolyspora algeriensis]
MRGSPDIRPFRALDHIADWSWLDKPAKTVRKAVFKVFSNRQVRDVLHGVWLGHPLHPMSVQVPIGAFLSAGVVDALPDSGPGERRVAGSLITMGVLTSLPAALSGLTDFAQGQPDQQRTGLVHATANSAALACYLVSLRQRARGRQAAAVATGWAGLTLLATGGLLGGHLSYHQANGANQAEDVLHIGPREWTEIGNVHDLPDRVPVQRMAGEVPVVVLRDGEDTHVLADRCSHASGPLHEGTLSWPAGPGEAPCLECPWHGSVFRVGDGSVVHGPATAPQPGFHTRVVGDRLQIRLR